MKKFISLLLIAALIFTCVCGCSGNAEPEAEETAALTQPIEEVELVLPEDLRPYLGVTLNFASPLSETDPRSAVLGQVAEVFEAKTGAAIRFTWHNGDEATLSTQVQNGGADIFATSVDLLESTFQTHALDLSAMSTAAGYAGHSYLALREQIINRCGKLCAIPQEPLLYGMYCNTDALAACGLTDYPDSWEEFLSFSETILQNGFMPMTMDVETSNIILELHLERHLGMTQFITLLSQGHWNRDTKYIDLFRLAIAYAEAGYLAKGDPATFPAGQNKLALSNVAMIAGSNELCRQVSNSTMTDVNWGIFPYPGDGPGMGYAVESRVLAIGKDSPNAQAAFDFIMMLTTGEYDRLYALSYGGLCADPANPCTIAGAEELLKHADTWGFGLLQAKDTLLFSRLWSGWYKTPSYFAIAMNGLAKNYKDLVIPSVG